MASIDCTFPPHGLNDSPVSPADGSPPSLLHAAASSPEAAAAAAAAASYDHFKWHTPTAALTLFVEPPEVVGACEDLNGDAPEHPTPGVRGGLASPASPAASSPATSPATSASSMELGDHLGVGGPPPTASMDIVPRDTSPDGWGLGRSAASAATAAAADEDGGSWDEGALASPPSLSCWAAAWPVARRVSRRRRRGKRGGGFGGPASPAGSWSASAEAAAADALATEERLGARVRAAAAAAVAAGVAVPAAAGAASGVATGAGAAVNGGGGGAGAGAPPGATAPAAASWTAASDVTAAHVAAGRDVQGIPWDTMLFSRESYREQRLAEQRATYDSARLAAAGVDGVAAIVAAAAPAHPASPLFSPHTGVAASGASSGAPAAAAAAAGVRPLRALRFVHGTRRVRCSINHFQLRNLVWAPSPHDVYLLQDNGVVHWDAVSRSRRCVVDLSGSTPGLPRVQVSTLTAGAGLLLAGGFDGELVAATAATGRLVHSGRLSAAAGAITTGLAVYEQDPVHGPTVLTCSNDAIVRTFDASALGGPPPVDAAGGGGSVGGVVATHHLPWAANHVSRQPRGGRLLAVAGDDAAVLLLDAAGGRSAARGPAATAHPGVGAGATAGVATLAGHTDHCFATAWAPDGVVVATGSQDGTARLWDVRQTGAPLGVLHGPAVGPVRGLRFSPCGRLLAVAEPRDYVRVAQVASVTCGGGRGVAAQDVDVFGEVGGLAFTPEGAGLFVGIHDDNYGGLLEMEVRSGRRGHTDAVGL